MSFFDCTEECGRERAEDCAMVEACEFLLGGIVSDGAACEMGFRRW